MDNTPVIGMTVMPWGCDEDPLMGGAFVAMVQFALGEDECLARFKEETGHDMARLASRPPMAAMVDRATGFEGAMFGAFADWCAVNLWGDENSAQDPESEPAGDEG